MDTNFNLRPWQIADVSSLARYANNYNIAQYMTNGFPHPYTPKDALNFIEMTLRPQLISIFAIEINGEAAGGIGLHPQNDIHIRNAELGYWLAEPFWGRGIATSAVRQMVDFGFKSMDIYRIFARPFGSNFGSQRVLEKAGFNIEARIENAILKFDRLEDELIYGIRRNN